MSRLGLLVGASILRSVPLSIALAFPVAAQAGGMALNEIRAKEGVQVSLDELKQLMPNAKVVSHSQQGSTRRWTNEPSGEFVASSDVRRDPSLAGKTSTARGTWHVGDNGTYCVTLEWPGRSENWCRYIFQVGGKYYGVKSIADGAAIAHEFEFSK